MLIIAKSIPSIVPKIYPPARITGVLGIGSGTASVANIMYTTNAKPPKPSINNRINSGEVNFFNPGIRNVAAMNATMRSPRMMYDQMRCFVFTMVETFLKVLNLSSVYGERADNESTISDYFICRCWCSAD